MLPPSRPVRSAFLMSQLDSNPPELSRRPAMRFNHNGRRRISGRPSWNDFRPLQRAIKVTAAPPAGEIIILTAEETEERRGFTVPPSPFIAPCLHGVVQAAIGIAAAASGWKHSIACPPASRGLWLCMANMRAGRPRSQESSSAVRIMTSTAENMNSTIAAFSVTHLSQNFCRILVCNLVPA